MGVTLIAARNSQAAFDRNADNFSDIPEYTRYTFNPRLFHYGNSTTIRLGLNTSFEDRTGGDMQVIAGNGDAIFHRLMLAIGREDMAHDPQLIRTDGRVPRTAEIAAAIQSWCATQSIDTALKVFTDADVHVGQI
mgnify:CR=1 FL=1